MSFLENRQRVTDGGILLYLELSAPTIPGVLRLVNDNRDWVAGGQNYVGFPFGFKLPDDTADQSPRTMLTISNVGRSLTADLEGMSPGDILTARIMIADRETPTVFEQEFTLPVTFVSVTSSAVTASLGVDHWMRQQAVRIKFTPFRTPGVF